MLWPQKGRDLPSCEERGLTAPTSAIVSLTRFPKQRRSQTPEAHCLTAGRVPGWLSSETLQGCRQSTERESRAGPQQKQPSGGQVGAQEPALLSFYGHVSGHCGGWEVGRWVFPLFLYMFHGLQREPQPPDRNLSPLRPCRAGRWARRERGCQTPEKRRSRGAGWVSQGDEKIVYFGV